MKTFAAAYYIDEIHKNLGVNIQDSHLLCDYYQNWGLFSIDGLPDLIDHQNLIPEIAVAYNLLSRGIPTRSSILLASYLLQEVYEIAIDVELESSSGEYIADILIEEIDALDKELAFNILSKYSKGDSNSVLKNHDEFYLKFFYLNLALSRAACIQKSLLLSCLTGKLKGKRQYCIIINGLNVEFSTVIINDLNSYLNSLAQLSGSEKTPSFILAKNKKEADLEISGNWASEFTSDNKNKKLLFLNETVPTDSVLFSKFIHTDKITYGPLGYVEENEENGKRIQEFIFYEAEKKGALLFFLKNLFRKNNFKPGQLAIINRAIQSLDVIGILPTGGGKSLTYQLCALLQPGTTIVIDPINSLMKDQYEKLLSFGINRACFLNYYHSKEQFEKLTDQLIAGDFLIVFVSPERLQIQKFRDTLFSSKTSGTYFTYAVIDEAHCVSEWGHDFRQTYLRLAENLRRFCPSRGLPLCFLGLTATASFDVLADAQRELGMAEDAIITLPPDAVDRKELNFEIIKTNANDQTLDNLAHYVRDGIIGELKYPILQDYFEKLPEKIALKEKEYGYINSQPTKFYQKEKDFYKNAGIIFCPTKSNKLRNGVLKIKEFLSKDRNLEIGSFFSGIDDDTIADDIISEEAAQSVSNQEKFIGNKQNLMIATKAFGMGIDKPNIRYSIHYTFPNSVESFYQEAGRAGRDGFPSICSILYHPADIHTNEDFLLNSFKGVNREKAILSELLTEIKYEDQFFLHVLKRQLLSECNLHLDLRLWPLNEKKPFRIYVNGPFNSNLDRRKAYGFFDLRNGLQSSTNGYKNVTDTEALIILSSVERCLKELVPDAKYLDWLCKTSEKGIETLLKENPDKDNILKIGFTNDVIKEITLKLKTDNADIDARVVRAGYNFSHSPEEFIENLIFRFAQFRDFRGNLVLSEENRLFLIDNYHSIRNGSDTQRAIYRLCILGIVDDYVIDYAGRLIEIRFKGKSEDSYRLNFRNYLRRYLGVETTNELLKEVDEVKEASVLKRFLWILTGFVENEIAEKRKRSVLYMKELCELAIKEGEKPFRENIIFYFTSKYARLDYLPRALENGKLEDLAVVNTYIGYIFEPPDGLGGQKDNAKHLRGACTRLLIGSAQENSSLKILNAFSLFTLEIKDNETVDEILAKETIQTAIGHFKEGFEHFTKTDEEWSNCFTTLNLFYDKSCDINPQIEPVLKGLVNEVLISRTTKVLREFNKRIQNIA